MSLNCAIYEPGTGRILHFLTECTRSGNSFRGTNGRYVINARHSPSVRWTEDDCHMVFDPETGLQTGWSPETIEGLREAANDRDIGIVDRQDLIDRLDHLRGLARITDAQVGTYIGANVTDLASARTYLVQLTKNTRDVLRLALWLLRKQG